MKDWFTRLPPKLVDGFKELGHLFLATRKRKKNVVCLMSIRQGKEESLKDFLLWFNKEKLQIDCPNEETIINALMHGLDPKGPLMAELSKSLRTLTLRQFLRKVE